MALQYKDSERVRFAAFEFDCRTGDLRRDGTSLKLQPQPAKVLGILIRRAGEIVTRQELAEQLWGAETFVDFEHGLNYAVRQIRTALEDDAERPRFLETLPKRGYRFIGSLEVPEAREETSLNAIAPEITVAAGRSSRRVAIALLMMAVVIAVLMAGAYLRRRAAAAASDQRIASLAVLPLHNLSRDPEQEYFSDGMTDELITDLAQLSGLKVISHTSVERYKGTNRSLPDIAHELGVDAVVEGTILRSNDRVRITAQLIDARSDRHLWADSYERDLRDVLALQRDVARDIASQVATKLTARERERLWTMPRISPQAHEAYLKGLFAASKLTPEGLQKGIEFFDRAIQLDAGYAPAYAGKAEAYGWASAFLILPPREVLPKAKVAATKALELDETLSQAHHSLAWVSYALDWKFSAAEEQFKRAVELNPNDVTAHLWFGMFLAERNRVDESMAEMKRAEQLDPLSLMVNALAATPLLVSRQYDKAIVHAQNTLAMDPGNPVGRWILITAYERKGDFPKAIEEMEKGAILAGQNADKAAQQMAPLRNALRDHGAQGYWQFRLKTLDPHADPFDAAVLFARVGENDKALASLEKSYAARSTQLLFWVLSDPAFDSLRNNAQFQHLLREIGT